MLAELDYKFDWSAFLGIIVLGLIFWILSPTIGLVVIGLGILILISGTTTSAETLNERTNQGNAVLNQIVNELKRHSKTKKASIGKR